MYSSQDTSFYKIRIHYTGMLPPEINILHTGIHGLHGCKFEHVPYVNIAYNLNNILCVHNMSHAVFCHCDSIRISHYNRKGTSRTSIFHKISTLR